MHTAAGPWGRRLTSLIVTVRKLSHLLKQSSHQSPILFFRCIALVPASHSLSSLEIRCLFGLWVSIHFQSSNFFLAVWSSLCKSDWTWILSHLVSQQRLHHASHQVMITKYSSYKWRIMKCNICFSVILILPLCYSKTIDFLQYVSMAGRVSRRWISFSFTYF